MIAYISLNKENKLHGYRKLNYLTIGVFFVKLTIVRTNSNLIKLRKQLSTHDL